MNFKRYRTSTLTVPVMLLMTGIVMACQVPVFRYALERWPPDRFRMLVISPSELDDSDKKTIRTFQDEFKSLVTIEQVSLSDGNHKLGQNLWNEHGQGKKTLVAMLYPDKATGLREQVAHITRFDEAALRLIATSPVRRELAKRLAEGHSAVWLLLESGDPEKDETAIKTLEMQLAKDKEWLKLPSAEELELSQEQLDGMKVKLKIDFSILRLKRNDPNELFLVDSLLNSELDLREYDEPIAFPVFGRGIVLYALVGKGIGEETIRTASSFIVGPCSCQVKEQNPGFDLLLEHDWEAALGETRISQPTPVSGASPKVLKIPPGKKSK